MVHKSTAMDFLLLQSIAAGRGHDFQLSDILLLLFYILELRLPLGRWENFVQKTKQHLAVFVS